MMSALVRILAFATLLPILYSPSVAGPRSCEIDRPVRIAGLDWDSNRFHVAVASHILKHGYGCASDVLPGSTIPLLTGLARGDLDLMLEVWKGQLTQAWEKAEKSGKVKLLGINYPDAVQGWFVPRYLVEGDKARAKGLVHVDDLSRHKAVFRDPEEPAKGRFYNCKLGWDCEVVNTKKLSVYGLTSDYTNFRPGSDAALTAAVASAFKRRKPILFYYWRPSWLLAKYDSVRLDEAPYDTDVWAKLISEKKPDKATAFPVVAVYTGANTDFAAKAPAIAEFVSKYRTSSALVSQSLLHMQENKRAGPEGAAVRFLRDHFDIWSRWVPDDVASAIKASLD